jgi:hypothetical protein
MDLELTSGALATLLEEATMAHPRECCGLLLGQGARIERAVPAANVHPDPERHFEIDPAALIAAHRAARAAGRKCWAITTRTPMAGPSHRAKILLWPSGQVAFGQLSPINLCCSGVMVLMDSRRFPAESWTAKEAVTPLQGTR